ncbi:MAG: hypothetical protein M3Y42_08720 [Actinomycetota bacterium]|nr:hypothetical protein [Actinomycetota bacterium]MDQ2957033.1 hypothetical protein [Actinomycetota bacterium]
MILLIGYLLLTLVVAAVLFYAVVALLPAGLSVPPQRDQLPFELPPDRRLRAGDLDRMRLPISLRGYRFSETDDLIDRLAAEIVVRDEEIARLRQQPGASADSSAGTEVLIGADEDLSEAGDRRDGSTAGTAE